MYNKTDNNKMDNNKMDDDELFKKRKLETLRKILEGEDQVAVDIPLNELDAVDVSDERLEKYAKGYFIGKTAVGRRRDVRKALEDKVVKRIGNKGKYLVDKLFELIEGVYLVDRVKEVKGKEEIKYYKIPPNLSAIVYALDRVLGKPKQLSVQANFSLSQLLIKTNKESSDLSNGFRSYNNQKISEESDIFY